MENIVETALRSFFAKRTDLFPEKGTFLHFKNDKNFTWAEGYQSTARFGSVVYEKDDCEYASDSLVLKISPESVAYKDITLFHFINEIYFHASIVPFFDSFRPTSLFANFYNSQLEIDGSGYRAVLIFENLQARSYHTTKRRSFLDFAHLSLMLRKLGEFHAYSYKARQCAGHQFRSLGRCLRKSHAEMLRTFENTFCLIGERGLGPLVGDLKYGAKVKIVRQLLENAEKIIMDASAASEDDNETWVLCHGDYLRSNVMFKYASNDEPVDMKMIDFANCGIASPVLDLALLLYVNADQRMRDEHWDELIDEYYAGLCETFPEVEVPAKIQILHEFRRKSFIAYMVASFFLGRLIAEDNGLPDITELLPEEYRNKVHWEVSWDVKLSSYIKLGGTLATNALTDILKDMIDRGFV